jgi:hypothetical protein
MRTDRVTQQELSATVEAPQDREMVAIASKFRLGEEPSDFAFWQTQTPQARLAALERIRCEYHGWRDGAQPAIEKVYRIIKR